MHRQCLVLFTPNFRPFGAIGCTSCVTNDLDLSDKTTNGTKYLPNRQHVRLLDVVSLVMISTMLPCMAYYFTNGKVVSALVSITYYCSVHYGSVDPVDINQFLHRISLGCPGWVTRCISD